MPSYKVYEVYCKNCQSILNQKCQSVIIGNNNSINGFSSNIESQKIGFCFNKRKFQYCNCIVQDMKCKICKEICGYKVSDICELCQKLPHNHHRWIFIKVQSKFKGDYWPQSSAINENSMTIHPQWSEIKQKSKKQNRFLSLFTKKQEETQLSDQIKQFLKPFNENEHSQLNDILSIVE